MILAYIVYFSLLLLMIIFTIPVSSIKSPYMDIKIVNKFFFLFPILVISVVLGCRYGVGVDYFSYKELYDSQHLHSVFDGNANEFIFSNIYYWCYKAGFPYAFVQIILNIVFWFFFYISFDFDKRLFRWIILFFFLTGILFLCLNIQRQSIALAILFYAIRYVEKKCFLKFLFYVFMAAGFHLSAFLFIPVYFLWHIVVCLKNKCLQILLWSISFLFSAYFVDLISELSMLLLVGTPYERYGASVISWETARGSGVGLIVKGLIDVFIIFYSQKIFVYLRNSSYFHIVYFLFFIGIILSNIFQYNLLLGRVAFLFVSFRIVVLAYVCDYIFCQGKQIDKLIVISLLMLCLAYFIGMIYIENNSCSPFRFIA